jgi:hypothetical protein
MGLQPRSKIIAAKKFKNQRKMSKKKQSGENDKN